jgi:HAD superfamily hydrolase (TIGR01459 family)
VKNAVEENRLDIYLQPMVTLPQRKVRFYEAVTRLRDDKDQISPPTISSPPPKRRADRQDRSHGDAALRAGAAPPDGAQQGCRRVLQRLGGDARQPANFAQCLDFLEANRALAPSFVLEFKQATFRNLGPTETEHLAALSQRGYRFSIDHVTDLRIEPRELADRGVRFIKVPAALLLDPKQSSTSDIHPSDLSDLLGRFGIDLIAEKIEGERAVVDLLDYDVRFGQGFLFAPPRPLRPEGASATGGATPNKESSTPNGSSSTAPIAGPAVEAPPRATGNAALARRAAGPGLTGFQLMTSLHFVERLRDLVDGVEVILSDIWGVVHNGLESFPEACEALHTYRQRGGTVILITNAPRPADSVQRQLRKLGVADETYDAIVSSGDLTRNFVADHPGKKMFWLGPERDNSIHRGLDPVMAPLEQADYIVCTGLFDDETESAEDYRAMMLQARERKLPLICANPDIVVERGDRLIYCAGAIAELYRELGGEVIFYGKPHRPIYERAMALAAERRGRPTRSTGCWRSAIPCGPISPARSASASIACSSPAASIPRNSRASTSSTRPRSRSCSAIRPAR